MGGRVGDGDDDVDVLFGEGEGGAVGSDAVSGEGAGVLGDDKEGW